MNDKKVNNETPLFSTMHIALLILCAVLLSFYAINGLYARFSSEETSSDTARVARFDVSSTCEKTGEDANNNSVYKVTVANDSEVTVTYTITCTGLPTGITLVVNNIGNNFTLAPGATAVHQVSFDDKSSSAHDDVSGTIKVRVEQVD